MKMRLERTLHTWGYLNVRRSEVSGTQVMFSGISEVKCQLCIEKCLARSKS